MAHAVRFRSGTKPGSDAESAADKWEADTLRERVEENVFGEGFPRVLAGEKTDAGQKDDDQENEVRLVKDDLGDRPDHFLALYRTADSEDIDEFINAFEEGVLYDARWFVIEPHDCTHDREEDGPCTVYDGEDLEDKTIERGGVPETFSFS